MSIFSPAEIAFEMRSTALSMSFIRKGSCRNSRLGLKKRRASSNVLMPLWTSNEESTGSMPSSAESCATVAGSAASLILHSFSIGICGSFKKLHSSYPTKLHFYGEIKNYIFRMAADLSAVRNGSIPGCRFFPCMCIRNGSRCFQIMSRIWL